MSRSGYIDDYGCDNQWDLIRWRGAVNSAIKGRRGQAFLKELLIALDNLPVKRLISSALITTDGTTLEACALGVVGLTRGLEMVSIDVEDRTSVAEAFGIAEAMAAEIMFENDEAAIRNETPEQRYERVRKWVIANIKIDPQDHILLSDAKA